jgi:hypothetical protein
MPYFKIKIKTIIISYIEIAYKKLLKDWLMILIILNNFNLLLMISMFNNKLVIVLVISIIINKWKYNKII